MEKLYILQDNPLTVVKRAGTNEDIGVFSDDIDFSEKRMGFRKKTLKRITTGTRRKVMAKINYH